MSCVSHPSNAPSRRQKGLLALVLAAAVLLLMPSAASANSVVHRVNAGGPSQAGDPPWSSDTALNPSPYSNATATKTSSTTAAIDMTDPSIPSGTPPELFQSERYDPKDGEEMAWDFPVTAGQYEVRLYFAETYTKAQKVGARRFDVSIEGFEVLDEYDIFAKVGANKGVVESFQVISDGKLDIDFAHVAQNPTVRAIEIIRLPGTPNELDVSPTKLDFGEVDKNTSVSKAVKLTNLGGEGDPSITVDATTVDGTDASQFSDDFDDANGVVLAPGEATTFNVSFSPTRSGPKSAALEIAHSGDGAPDVVPLAGSGSSVIHRVNAGGEPVSGPPDWGGDTAVAPSPYVNAAGTGNKTYSTTSKIDTSDPSVPVGTPQALFQNERYDPAGAEEMAWDMPVSPGRYEVRLYFAEIYTGAQSLGARMFDVAVEGSLVLDDYDVFADVGANKGVVKSVVVSSDDNLDIDFAHVKGDPAIKAIEVVKAPGIAGALDAAPASVDFGDVGLRKTSTKAISVTNLGEAGDPAIIIDGTSIAGTDADQFSDDFDDATDLTLQPEESATIQATFAPTSEGSKSASLDITHSGDTSALQVPLSGAGSRLVHRVNAGGGALSASTPWQVDTVAEPSPYVNSAGTGNKTYATAADIDTTDPSIPEGTPPALFKSERYDPEGGEEMMWDFPVASGRYEVRLYFAETASGVDRAGARMFDVAIEGTQVLNDYDVFAEAGSNKGVMKSFEVMTDATLDIDFAHLADNPAIKGIEILKGRVEPNKLGASPDSLDFGEVVTKGKATQQVKLTNLGEEGDPSITVDETTIDGTDAVAFSDNFDDAADPLLAPGQSTTVDVTLAPQTSGDKTATLKVANSGTSSPLAIPLSGHASEVTVGFGKSPLQGEASNVPTSLQFGPDGRLYAAEQSGAIKAYEITRNAANDYSVTATETLGEIQAIPNHDDNGAPNSNVKDRLVTGLVVTGTADDPVVYVTSSDPRIGGGSEGSDLNLDTNSSTVSRLKRSGSTWERVDLVRGLPRSEENHAANGLTLDAATNTLYVAMGGNTNHGAPSNNFALLPEFALSAAVLSVDLDTIGDSTFDLPTLDDEDRAGTSDENDPFGGNDGKNQAKLTAGGPVQVHASGLRNPYDVALTESGRMYTVDNGGNAGWGDIPKGEGAEGNCTNEVNEPGVSEPDSLHLIGGSGWYGGHPNPTRGSQANTFNTSNPQSPVEQANKVECDDRTPGSESGALTTFPSSTNGLVEYTASNFSGAMKGDLLASGYIYNEIYRIELNDAGDAIKKDDPLFSTVGAYPLDVTALGDGAKFPGTIWVADPGTGEIVAFEPNDYDGQPPACTGSDDPALDEDGDKYDNADEIDNSTDPCSSADVPPDADGDHTSDLNDADDDNDGVPDESDPFAIDADNGKTTKLPIDYSWENDSTDPGGLLNLGFTGLMSNGTANYKDQYDPGKMTAGGAAGVTTIDEVSEGSALGAGNDQKYGFQFGVDADPAGVDTFTAHSRIVGPFSGLTPEGKQSMGLFVGAGDQDNYLKIATSANDGSPGIEVTKEVDGAVDEVPVDPVDMPGPDYVDLYLTVDPDAGTVQPSYSVTTGGVTGSVQRIGSPMSIPSSWVAGSTGLAVGMISTSAGSAPPFPATWDFMKVTAEPPRGAWKSGASMPVALGEVAAGIIDDELYAVGEDNADTLRYDIATDAWTSSGIPRRPYPGNHHAAEVVEGKLHLFGGLDNGSEGKVQIYNPATNAWTEGPAMPFAAGSSASALIDGKVYVAGGVVGSSTTDQAASFDPATGKWTSIAPMPQARNHAAAATDGKKLYVFGGRGPGSGDSNTVANGFDTVQVYDPATDKWESSDDPDSTLAPLPQARGGMGKAVFRDGEFYVIGGETKDGDGATADGVYDRVDVYNPSRNTWRLGKAMPTARHGIFPLLRNGEIYVAGGGTVAGHSSSTVLEIFDP